MSASSSNNPSSSAQEQTGNELAELLGDARQAIDDGDSDTAVTLLEALHPADKAELFNHLSERERSELTFMLAEEFDHEILPELTSEATEQVVDALGVDKSAEVLTQMESDDVLHVLEELSQESQQGLLDAISRQQRGDIEEAMAYPEDSAARLMTKKLVYVPEFWSVGDSIDYLRNHDDLPANFYVIYVIDAKYHPIGRVPLGRVMKSQRDVKIVEIMETETYAVSAQMDQEEVAHRFTKYGLVETPVVNEQGRLLGTITVDDVVHVIHEEEEEDYLRAGGVKSQDIQAGLKETMHQRFPWLFVNLLTAVLASTVIGFYADTIEQWVALAVLMPIVASMGGNAGTQSVTVAVRALATRQLKSTNSFAAMRKELLIGLMNGVGLAALMAVGAWAWYGDVRLAIIFGVATVLTLMIAGFSGAAIPIALNRLKIDPAVSSGVFLTTVTDVVGFLAFLGLASWMM